MREQAVTINLPPSNLSSHQQLLLRGILEQGLPIADRPYLAIAEKIDALEHQVIAQIQQWRQDGLIRRFGVIVKHRQLGYRANAMVVWNIPDSEVDTIAGLLAQREEVSLCYRRPRRLPDWPYNLFCMIHGKNSAQVEEQIRQLTEQLKLQHIAKDVLFSHKAYKQHGARYQHRYQPESS